MALIVISAPDNLSYTGNPFGFEFATDVPAENILWVEISDFPGTDIYATIRKESIQGVNLSAKIQLQEIYEALTPMPNPSSDINTVKILTVKAQFTTGLKPDPFVTPPFIVSAIYGAQTKLKYAQGRRALDSYNVMTNQTQRPTTPQAKTFLQVGSDSLAGFDPSFNVTIIYKDGSEYIHPNPFVIFPIIGNLTKTINVSWDVYNYGTLDPGGAGKEIAYVLLSFNDGTILYLRPVIFQKYGREFHWVNGLGGLDSAVFIGSFKQSVEIKREIAESFLDVNYNLESPQFSQFSQDAGLVFSGNSGYMPKAEIQAAAGILTAPKAWERIDNQFIPIIVTGDGGLIFDEFERLYAFDFTYKHAFNI